MECSRVPTVAVAVILFSLLSLCHGWGSEGHYTVCKIAQSRLSEAAGSRVKELLPKYAGGELGKVCIWADRVKFRYHWSSPLHYIDTPDHLCAYNYTRDCKDESGMLDRCVAGAINNYTTQLLSFDDHNASQYNLTEALMFLSHFLGDIHQPLHVGFTSDRGANTINVHWYTRKQVLHHVWDSNIIETAMERFYDADVDGLVDAIQHNITREWADEVKGWETCGSSRPQSQTPCPDIYATEGIKAACEWAYAGVSEGSVLQDEYFLSRLPIVNRRLAQGGVRLAATLNRIFK